LYNRIVRSAPGQIDARRGRSRVCGTDRAGSGGATLTYHITVEQADA
jgi:hypothetical protein